MWPIYIKRCGNDRKYNTLISNEIRVPMVTSSLCHVLFVLKEYTVQIEALHAYVMR